MRIEFDLTAADPPQDPLPTPVDTPRGWTEKPEFWAGATMGGAFVAALVLAFVTISTAIGA